MQSAGTDHSAGAGKPIPSLDAEASLPTRHLEARRGRAAPRMHAIFHALSTTADVTDLEFRVLAHYVSGTFEPGMLVRFRAQTRLLRTYVLHSIELNDIFTKLEKRPTYDLRIQCGTFEETEYLHALRIQREDFELISSPDR